MKTTAMPKASINAGTRVELVGGPLCGEVKRWPSGSPSAAFVYYGGQAVCRYTGETTQDGSRAIAKHISG